MLTPLLLIGVKFVKLPFGKYFDLTFKQAFDVSAAAYDMEDQHVVFFEHDKE